MESGILEYLLIKQIFNIVFFFWQGKDDSDNVPVSRPVRKTKRKKPSIIDDE